MGARLERVRVPEAFPRERVVLGELHLLRGRLDGVLEEMAVLIARADALDEAWPRVEEAARLARRALLAAVETVPPLPAVTPMPGLLRVSDLSVDPTTRRQWWSDAEFELTPLHHRLLAVLAADPYRVFGKDELAAAVWGQAGGRANAVKMSVSRVRQALVQAGAPQGRFMVSLHGVGWALTRPD